MDRKKFIRNSIFGIASLATAGKILECYSKNENYQANTDSNDGICSVSPSETKGSIMWLMIKPILQLKITPFFLIF